jgi:hypothetical protein
VLGLDKSLPTTTRAAEKQKGGRFCARCFYKQVTPSGVFEAPLKNHHPPHKSPASRAKGPPAEQKA